MANEISIEERRVKLQREIDSYIKKGFRVISQTETTAQLLKPKKFSFLWAILCTFVLGIGLLIYLIYYWAKRDETVYLEVTPEGKVMHRR